MPKQMYPAKVNSPQTELAADITATDTTITVQDASALPDAHNLITIGSDENAETILYRGKNGNDLTDCIRGFQGSARAWSAGSKCARNYTAYDHDAARENIEENRAAAQTANTAITNHKNDKNNPHGVTKAQVGLGNVDNAKQATKTEFDAHVNNKSNPHGVTPAQIGAETPAGAQAKANTAEQNAKNASLPRTGGKVTGIVDFETTLNNGNKSVVRFTATDGKRYSISMRTDGSISLWNDTDGVTVARFTADGNDFYVGVNKPVWHSANFNPDTKFDKTGGPISGDITTSQGRIRLSYGSGVSYLQAGENAADTAAKMRITRMLSNNRLAEFEVLADSAKINGQEIYTAGNKPYVTGHYTGSGQNGRVISFGFTPSAVIVFPGGPTPDANFSMYGFYNSGLVATANVGDDLLKVTDGIQVSRQLNNAGRAYNYVAFR